MHSITGVFFCEKNIKKTIDKRKTMCYNKGELKEKECKNGRFKTRTRRTV